MYTRMEELRNQRPGKVRARFGWTYGFAFSAEYLSESQLTSQVITERSDDLPGAASGLGISDRSCQYRLSRGDQVSEILVPLTISESSLYLLAFNRLLDLRCCMQRSLYCRTVIPYRLAQSLSLTARTLATTSPHEPWMSGLPARPADLFSRITAPPPLITRLSSAPPIKSSLPARPDLSLPSRPTFTAAPVSATLPSIRGRGLRDSLSPPPRARLEDDTYRPASPSRRKDTYIAPDSPPRTDSYKPEYRRRSPIRKRHRRPSISDRTRSPSPVAIRRRISPSPPPVNHYSKSKPIRERSPPPINFTTKFQHIAERNTEPERKRPRVEDQAASFRAAAEKAREEAAEEERKEKERIAAEYQQRREEKEKLFAEERARKQKLFELKQQRQKEEASLAAAALALKRWVRILSELMAVPQLKASLPVLEDHFYTPLPVDLVPQGLYLLDPAKGVNSAPQLRQQHKPLLLDHRRLVDQTRCVEEEEGVLDRQEAMGEMVMAEEVGMLHRWHCQNGMSCRLCRCTDKGSRLKINGLKIQKLH